MIGRIIVATLALAAFAPWGCSPEAGLSCEGVAADLCRQAKAVALESLPDDEARAVQSVTVRSTRVVACNDLDEPAVDVDIQVAGHPKAPTITLAWHAGQLVPCSY